MRRGLAPLVAAIALLTACAPVAASPLPPAASGIATPAPSPSVDPGAVDRPRAQEQSRAEGESGAGDGVLDAADTALAALEALPVKGRAPRTGYSRDAFGQRWRDVDRNGCDTRNDVLARDLTAIERSGACTVRAGRLLDPYTGAVVDFARGPGTSALVQIDHVVALSDAWQKGAQQLTASRRELLANDPLNLLAVGGDANARKGDGDAATWLPPRRSYRCAYVARQVSVKAAYGLWVTRAERDAMRGVLASCPGEPALASAFAPALGSDASPPPAGPEATPHPAPSPAPQAPGRVSYGTCAEARAAGAAPLRAGDPGYRRALDGDGDGVACE